MKPIAAISIAALLVCSPALAQTQNQTQSPSAPSSSKGTGSNMGTGTTGAGGTSGTAAGGAAVQSGNLTMSPDDRLASRMIGATIRNANNESIGDINDLVLDQNGRVKAVIAGVGGFLGIGEQRVMLGYDQMQFSKDANGRLVVQSQFTREQLKGLPAWNEPSSTDSTGTTRTR